MNYTEQIHNRIAIALASAGVLFAALGLAVAASGATITVQPGHSIQTAINAAVAGDTVAVSASVTSVRQTSTKAIANPRGFLVSFGCPAWVAQAYLNVSFPLLTTRQQ